jgi:hypothetical protein
MKTVEVLFSNGDKIITGINGTNNEIRDYYEIGRGFNLGSVEDNVQTVKSIRFLYPVLGRDNDGNLHNYALVDDISKIDDLRCGCWLTQNIDASQIAAYEGYHLERWDWKNTERGDILTNRTDLRK